MKYHLISMKQCFKTLKVIIQSESDTGPSCPHSTFPMLFYFPITVFFWLGHSSLVTLTCHAMCVSFVLHTCCSIFSALNYWVPSQPLLITNQCLCANVEAVLCLPNSMLHQCSNDSYHLPLTCFCVHNTCCRLAYLLTLFAKFLPA